MEKIIIVIPIWRRPAILAHTVKNINALVEALKHRYEIIPYYIISASDPDLRENSQAIKNNFYCTTPDNKPVSNKLNMAINRALKYEQPDYIMNLGSDNLINPLLFDYYRAHIANETPFFGLNKSWLYDTLTHKTGIVTYNVIAGAGRMIHRSVFETVGDIYQQGLNDSMDTFSEQRIATHGISAVHIEVEDLPPLVIDLKSLVNIHTFFEVSTFENFRPLKFEL